MFLMLAEMADEQGQVVIDEAELSRLMGARFEQPKGVPAMRKGGRMINQAAPD